ncbi:hypothetical protein BUZ94_13435 [Mammaliicoccus sciuri]|uniref:hypothetical protein n=1 Tax=Mammaliicoccus sciuri TaxID=1296 RepID=UPI000E684CFC|nr:hypothetical protein [Mammaliicoccus sciuri]RIO07133.1 hypothetical protein BUZ94_13435 [Mammaliicoccus sciuri]
MRKYIVIKPRGFAKIDDSYREFEEYEVNKIVGVEAFIQQQVGQPAVERKVGDYILWISNPEAIVETEEGDIAVPETPDLTCNLLINEVEFAFGGVVVTANHRILDDKYEGLNEQDIANIMNLFTQTDTVLVEDEETGKYIAVDRVFDALLNYSGTIEEVPDDPVIEDIEFPEEDIENISEPEYEDTDPEYFDDIDFGDVELPMPDELPPEVEVEDDFDDLSQENLDIEVEDEELESL